MEQLVHRVSTIVVGESDRTRVFHSLEEMPKDLRKRLQQVIASENSATLLIADERGRQEIMHKLEGGQSPLESRLIESIIKQRNGLEPAAPKTIRMKWGRVAALAFVVIAALMAVGR
jgi:hypothetical protein